MKKIFMATLCLFTISACAQDMVSKDTTSTETNNTESKEAKATDASNNAESKDTSLSFFVTSKGSGKGGDLGGIAGADAHCQKLAEAVGSKDKTWRAYLSTSNENAKDRIGNGPWYNAKGTLIAMTIDDLHGENNAINKENGLSEEGKQVNGRGDSPNQHDILTGSLADGTVSADKTCQDWTSSASENVSAIVGHHDRIGLNDDAPSKSWNSSHASRGCSQEDLKGTGGDGLFYCFAKQ